METKEKLYKKAKRLIPGGTQLLSKRPEMFLPEYWPSYYKKAKGCEIWSLKGKKYIDTSLMGVGSCILGYADEDVNKAVKGAIDNGQMSTLNVPEEVELAELLCKIHSWADMARFARTGGESASIAIRIARAYTQKDIVLFCGYHGWHDWYLSSNIANKKSLDGHLLPGLSSKGVPRNLKATAIPFKFNDIDTFLKLVKKYNNRIAAVIMEPIRSFEPKKGFFRTIRKVTKEKNIVLIFDEISSGFRIAAGGAHLKFGIKPDMAVFAKAMSNGFPMAAIIGRKKVMQAAQDTFISSTYWTERIGPVAALATIRKYEKYNVHKHLEKIGKMVQAGWAKLAKKHELDMHVSGMYPLSHFSFDYKNNLVLKALFTQEMLKKGFLASNSFYVSFAHKKEHIIKYLKATDEVFAFIKKALSSGKPEKCLKGPVCHSGFSRLA